MQLSGSIYRNLETGQDALAIYGKIHDVTVQPFPIREFRESMVHLTYSKGDNQGSVDIYPLQAGEALPKTVNINKIFETDRNYCNIELKGKKFARVKRHALKDFVKPYDIGAQISTKIPKKFSKDLLDAGITDVLFFCQDKIAKTNRHEGFNYVNKIIPVTKVKEVEAKRLIDGGKQWFVPVCGLEANLDFGEGCETSWIPFYENANFDSSKGLFTGFVSIPWVECDYCYAGIRHKNFAKTFYKIDPKHLEELLLGGACLDFESDEPIGRLIKTLRFGKRTEVGSKYFTEKLLMSLEVMEKVRTKGVLPTKLLKFDRQLVKPLKNTGTLVLYSFGGKNFDKFERGAVIHGATNEWRLEQMYKFRESKVNAIPYLHIFAGDEPTQENLKYLKKFKKEDIPVQLLPIRFQNKRLFERMTKRKWDDAKNKQVGLFEISEGHKICEEDLTQIVDPRRGGYERYEKNLTAIVHPKWLKIIGKKNKRQITMCHHNSSKTYCGGCGQQPGSITDTVHIEKKSKGIPGRKKKRKKSSILKPKKGLLELYLENNHTKIF